MAEISPIASPDESGQKRITTRDLPTGTVTMLFTVIEGSTLLLEQLGEGYINVLEEYRSLLRTTFLACSGHEVDTQGDAFFVAFARATDAVSAAIAAQRSLFTHLWPEGVTLRVRIGLHTGEPSVSTEGYVGLDVRGSSC
jgi:class 3 adenylate cyclase